jgi:Fic family protein
VREIHKRLVEGVRGEVAGPGEYRRVQNYVVDSTTGQTVYTPPPANGVPIMMVELLDWLNREHDVHPVLVSGIAQFQ